MACEQPGAWSGGLSPQLGAPLFAAAVKQEDGTRPTAANTPGWKGLYPPYIPTDLLTRNIDIQGFSHAGAQQGDSNAHLDGNPALGQMPNTPAIFHNVSRYRTKPVFGSECCSCNTMRDEDVGCESSNGWSKPPLATEKLLESTDGVLRPSSVFSQGGSLLPSIYADARCIDAVIVSQAKISASRSRFRPIARSSSQRSTITRRMWWAQWSGRCLITSGNHQAHGPYE